jgi:hypothetical protein
VRGHMFGRLRKVSLASHIRNGNFVEVCAGKRLHDNDRWNLAKAISGFANSEGGVIVWRVDCRDTSGSGDVASAKVPIQNPKRFVSWLEGVVSGYTVPAHPLVRHTAVESSPGLGFAVSHIPKSYLALHQCLKPLQYYIRAGSDFVPTPHAVLEGLFGRRPQPFVFHMWTIQPAKLVQQLTGLVAIGPDKRLAETVLKKRQVAIAEGKYLDKRSVPSCTFTELARLYLPWAQVNHRGYASTRSRVAHLREEFGPLQLREITPMVVDAYVSCRATTRTPATVIGKCRSCIICL